MADAKAKTINLLLYEGDLEGVISIGDSSWNSGELYSAPRDSVSELLETDACKKYGVYLLLSKSMVYVGQSSDLSKRITQHTVGKEIRRGILVQPKALKLWESFVYFPISALHEWGKRTVIQP